MGLSRVSNIARDISRLQVCIDSFCIDLARKRSFDSDMSIFKNALCLLLPIMYANCPNSE